MNSRFESPRGGAGPSVVRQHGRARGGLTRALRRARGALLAAAALLAGCNSGQPQRVPFNYQISRWDGAGAEGRMITTQHYDIYTTVKDETLLASLPGLIEDAYTYYTTLVPPEREVSERMKVYFFATRGQWAEFTRNFTGYRSKVFLQIRNGGYSERGVSVIQYVSHQTTFPIMVHEGFHQYLHHYVNPAVPAWLNEGLATLCEGQRWRSLSLNTLDRRPDEPVTTRPADRTALSGIVQFDPWYNPSRRNDLSEAVLSDRLFPLKELLETHAGRVVQGSNRSVMAYYAQVWALMLFLEHGENGKYAARFKTLRSALGEGELEKRAQAEQIWSSSGSNNVGELMFRAFISDDLDEVEQEYRAFLREAVLSNGPKA